jgi:hypothetical protein
MQSLEEVALKCPDFKTLCNLSPAPSSKNGIRPSFTSLFFNSSMSRAST